MVHVISTYYDMNKEAAALILIKISIDIETNRKKSQNVLQLCKKR